MPKFIVRHGSLRTLSVMTSHGDESYSRGAKVVIRSSRGLEVGEILTALSDEAARRTELSVGGSVLRNVSADDQRQIENLETLRIQRLDACRREIDSLGLSMKLVDLEQLFGGERVVVYYVAENRIDFRELVRRLCAEFQSRVEMNQIGVRDEAKLLADYGDCGKPVCCNTHLVAMPPVSMRMAKLQRATLDPTKISGRCGRLKCCLRYEFDTYEELLAQLPPVGSQIVTGQGRCRVTGHEILSQQLLVETEDHRRLLIDSTEVLSIIHRAVDTNL